MNTYENYIMKLIDKTNQRLETLSKKKEDYTKHDYELSFARLSGQLDVLYMIITGHDNKYSEEQLEDEKEPKKQRKKK